MCHCMHVGAKDVCSLVAAIFTLTKPSASSAQDNLAGNLHIPTLQQRGILNAVLHWRGFGGFCCFSSEDLTQGTPYLHSSLHPNLVAFPHLFSSPQSHFRSDPFRDL